MRTPTFSVPGRGPAFLFLLVSLVLPAMGRAEAPAAVPASEARSTQTVHRFHAPSLGRKVAYIAITPDPMEPGRRYPVLYLLHGATGSYRDWTSNTSATALLAGRPLIVVTPDGGPYGWYADSRFLENSNYETFISRDLIADVDRRLPTIASREGRAIAGLSMGGHGALSLAAKHPDLFASASSMSGILNLRNHPKSWKLNEVFGELTDHEAEWRRHNVYDLAERFTTAGVRLLFDSGTSDTAAIEDNRQVHRRLTDLGVPHDYREYPGAHTWKYWSDRLPEHVEFHSTTFRTGTANARE